MAQLSISSLVMQSCENLAKDENYFHHQDDGVRISIQGDRADRKRTKEALGRALAQLDK
ncbi:hypothetical protein ACFL1S_03660 [Pseudomonadota bacterium]